MVDLHGGPATCKQSLLDSARAGNARTGSRWKTGMSQYCKVFHIQRATSRTTYVLFELDTEVLPVPNTDYILC
jgi:hypothetical protein